MMQVYTGMGSPDLAAIPPEVKRAERLGFDGIGFNEFSTDSFLASALALEHTERMKVGPAVAIVFPRSPMITAYMAWSSVWVDDVVMARYSYIWSGGRRLP